MSGRLQGKTAIVTGAGRPKGLGEAIARAFAAEGANLLLTDLGAARGEQLSAGIGTSAELEAIAERLRGSGAAVETIAGDVRSEADVIATVDRAVSRFGALDIVVNNAAVGYLMHDFLEFPTADWELVLAVNLTGPFLFTRIAARQMVAQNKGQPGRGGRIINIASQAAKSAAPQGIAYTSSKHGLIGLTRTSAVELGPHGITVNAVCPNHVTTGLGAEQNRIRAQIRGTDIDEVLEMRRGKIPLGRVGLPEDTAKTCVFLASDEAAYITGEAMNVSGGEETH